MAKEISIGVTISFRKGGAQVSRSESITVDVTGDAFSHEVQAVGITEEELAQGSEVGTPGYMFIKNLDATNYVEIGSTTGVYDIKLKAGEVCLYRHNSATVYAKANTAICNVEYLLMED